MAYSSIESIGQLKPNYVPAVSQSSPNNAYFQHLGRFEQDLFPVDHGYALNTTKVYPAQLNTTALVTGNLNSLLPPAVVVSGSGETSLMEAQGMQQDVLLYPVGLTKSDSVIQTMYPTQLGVQQDIGANYPIQNVMASEFYVQAHVEVNREASQVTVAI